MYWALIHKSKRIKDITYQSHPKLQYKYIIWNVCLFWVNKAQAVSSASVYNWLFVMLYVRMIFAKCHLTRHTDYESLWSFLTYHAFSSRCLLATLDVFLKYTFFGIELYHRDNIFSTWTQICTTFSLFSRTSSIYSS